MGLFDFIKSEDINKGVEEFRNTPGAVLLDVREAAEYKGGRIPGSLNIPLSFISEIEDEIEDFSTPIYIYCLSGFRARQAKGILSGMGYKQLKSIGGINGYSGEIIRG